MMLLVLFAALLAETVVLQNGLNNYNGCADTYIVQGSDKVLNTRDILSVQGFHCSACIDERTLIRFDLASISRAGEINKATLSLFCTDQPRAGGSEVRIHTISRAWDETKVSWMKATEKESWSKQGGDFSENPAASYSYNEELKSWHTADITSIVKAFVASPQSNNGFILYMEPIMHTVTYVSSNSPDAEHRPKLTIEGKSLPISNKHPDGTATISHAINRGKLAISMPSSELRTLTVTTPRGQIVRSQTITAQRALIDLTDRPSGVYIVRIRDKTDSYTVSIPLF